MERLIMTNLSPDDLRELVEETVRHCLRTEKPRYMEAEPGPPPPTIVTKKEAASNNKNARQLRRTDRP